MIRGEHIRYSYKEYDDEGRVSGSFPALRNVNVRVTPGEFVAILGPNGSGKSTLARHMNALLLPDEGTMYVGGLDTRPEENLLEVRRTAGMVFQNPDNQIVAGIVEEDVAFGPENLGIALPELRDRGPFRGRQLAHQGRIRHAFIRGNQLRNPPASVSGSGMLLPSSAPSSAGTVFPPASWLRYWKPFPISYCALLKCFRFGLFV